MGNLAASRKPRNLEKTVTRPNYIRSDFTTSRKEGGTRCLNGISIAGEYIYTVEDGKTGIGSVSVFSYSGDFITSFSNSYMTHPWSIDTYRDNIYVTDTQAHAVFHYGDIDRHSVSTMVGGKGSDDTQFNCPARVSVSSKGDVYVADRYNDRVQVLDSRLKYLRSITHPTMTQPIDVKNVTNDLYVLSYYPESTSFHVHTFYANGQKSMYTLDSIQTMAQDFNFQFGPLNSIVMRDAGANQIRVFSRKGELLQEIEVEHTAGVILNRDSSIGVVLRGNTNHRFTIVSGLKI